MTTLHLAVGVLTVFLSWLGLRGAFRAPLRASPALLLLDATPVAAAWAILLCLSGRPVLASVMVAAACCGLYMGNRAKQVAASEPLVFTDAKLFSIFLYPCLYAEFAAAPVLLAAFGAVLCGFAALGYWEHPLWRVGGPAAVALSCLAAGSIAWAATRTIRRAATRPTLTRPTGAPAVDAALFGPIGSVILYSGTARLERPRRRLGRSPGRSDSLPARLDTGGPLILLQLESFFDARRLGYAVPRGLLPHYDRCIAGSIFHGLFKVPAYGANTVRTEFAALTGLSERELGLDHFNPYAAYARVPIDSIAWRLRAAGYRTVCIHPFAGSFYGRRRVMPNLGFDDFLDIEAFSGYHPGPGYVSDLTVVREIARVLSVSGPRTFIFAITMGNHSPWQRPALAPEPSAAGGAAFASFLAGLTDTDAALGALADVLRHDCPDGMFAAFGDHLPNFPHLLNHPGEGGMATDYLVWRPDHAFGERRHVDAHALPTLLAQAAELSQAKRRRRFPRLASVEP